MKSIVAILYGVLVLAPIAMAATSEERVELVFSGASLSEGSPAWKGASIKPSLRLDKTNIMNAELSWASRFEQSGFFASANLVHDYTPELYQVVGAGISTAGAFWPRYQAYTNLYRKWLTNRSLVTGFGVSANRYDLSSIAGHETTGIDRSSDAAVAGEVIYYFPRPLILEGGYRYQLSFPGRISSYRVFGALTWGYGLPYRIVARYDTGTEGYRPVSVDTIAVKYDSDVAGLRGELDLGERYSVGLFYEYYWNEFYTRNAYSLGFAIKL